jgi:hypothetical protein
MFLLSNTVLKGDMRDRVTTEIPLLSLSVSDPMTVLKAATTGLESNDPQLLEGLTGILKARMQTLTTSSDVSILSSDLLAGPTNLTVHRGSGNDVRIAFSGTARNSKVFREWLSSVASAMTEGNLRTSEFNRKEYVRTDVTAGDENAVIETGVQNGWSLLRVGGSGAEISLFAAQSGRAYVIANNEGLVTVIINANTSGNSTVASGTMDLAWFVTNSEKAAPFLIPLRPTIEALFGPSPSRLTWRASPIPEGISVQWSLTHAAVNQIRLPVAPKTTRP